MITIIKLRYYKPLLNLAQNAYPKSIYSITMFITLVLIKDFYLLVNQVFYTPIELLFLLVVFIIIDLITGIISASKSNTVVASIGFRQTLVKSLEYFIILALLTGIANVFGNNEIGGWVGTVVANAANIHWFGYLYILFTELKSIHENLSGAKGEMRMLLQHLYKKFFSDIGDPDNKKDNNQSMAK